MRKYLLTGIASIILGVFAYAQDYSVLLKDFKTPPQSDRPEVWWHWMDGNITKDGIRKDLEWMHRSGIGGVHVFDAGLNTPKVVEERLVYMHPEWKEVFRYALEVADSLGLAVTIPSSPGWSATGAPWVPLKDAMKRLVWREIRTEGGRPVHLTLPEPYTNKGKFQNAPLGSDMMDATSMRLKTDLYYEDIAVLAVRLFPEDRTLQEREAKVSSSGGKFTVDMLTDGDVATVKRLPARGEEGNAWILYEFPQRQTFSSAVVSDGRLRGLWDNEPPQTGTVLQVSDDGVSFQDVISIEAGGTVEQTVTFAPVSGRYFRLLVANPLPDQTMAAYGAGMVAPKYSKIAEFNLFESARVHHAEEKAGFASPRDLHRYPTTALAGGSFKSEVIDITQFVHDGILDWEAPEGQWQILRFGYSLTGKVNHPAPLEATGLEVDKLDSQAWTTYFREYFNRYKEIAGSFMGERGIQYVLTDSYEADQQTWTPAMMTEFKDRRGYDLLPWMPVLTGEIIESVDRSERFLFDWRKTIGELYAENYDRLSDIAKEYGLKGRYTESHENGRVYIVDGMDVKRSAEIPMSACWMPNDLSVGSTLATGRADIRESASVAHVFGQNIAAAESFTATGFGGRGWGYAPAELKRIADLEMSEGLNHFVIHESAHQPVDSLQPGLGLMTFGQWFNRHDTWAHEAKAWTDYLARSSFLLRQGRFMADVLIYYGEDTNITGKYALGLPDYVPSGYAYDFINATGLLRELSVKKGKLLTRSGMSYSVLCIDDDAPSLRSQEVTDRISELRASGVCICTPENLEAALRQEKIQPDVQLPSGMSYVHRTLPGTEIYWLSRPEKEDATVEVSFRLKGMKPQVWHPETGLAEEVSYRQENGRTIVQLDLVAGDAVFVVFHGKGTKRQEIAKTKVSEPLALDAPWAVHFQAGRGAPEKALFPKLISLSESENPGIRYFSGTAEYVTQFNMSGEKAGKIVLDLGEVHEMARVYVNGKDCGLLWKPPYRLDIADALITGENELRIEVTNLWPNRIIGDLRPDGGETVTYTSQAFYTQDSPLYPSGLLGPVKIVFSVNVK